MMWGSFKSQQAINFDQAHLRSRATVSLFHKSLTQGDEENRTR